MTVYKQSRHGDRERVLSESSWENALSVTGNAMGNALSGTGSAMGERALKDRERDGGTRSQGQGVRP